MRPIPAFICLLGAAAAGAAAGTVAGRRAARTVSKRNTAPSSGGTGRPAIPNLKRMTRQQVLEAMEGSGLTVIFETDPREHSRAAVGGGGRVTGWSWAVPGELHVRLSPD
jgi:hypothetical protein